MIQNAIFIAHMTREVVFSINHIQKQPQVVSSRNGNERKGGVRNSNFKLATAGIWADPVDCSSGKGTGQYVIGCE